MNKAYKILQSPIQRAEYLLKLNNITIPEGNTAVASDFLMEIMERNEEASRHSVDKSDINWDYLQFQVDEANTKEELVELLQKVRNDCAECEQKLESTLMANDLEAAKTLVITMRYFISLENSIKEKGNRIGVVLWEPITITGIDNRSSCSSIE